MTTINQDHAILVAALKADGSGILSDLSPLRVDMWHMATGICGEAGEILEIVKKHVAYGKPLSRDKIVSELGDIEFYLEGIRQNLGVSREECLHNNICKLTKRYPSGYSNEAAIERVDVGC